MSEQFLHRQDRHSQLDYVRPLAGLGQVAFAAVDHALLHGQLAGLCIQVDTHHFEEQPTLT